VDCDLRILSIGVQTEEVQTVVEVFGSWSELWDSGNLNCASIVLKQHFTSDLRRSRLNGVAPCFHFLENLHDGDGVTKCVAETGKFALC
jgi:hypothetical protein